MLINISNISLDEIKLNKGIDEFEITHNHNRAHLFMNHETLEMFKKFESNENTETNGGICALYNGRIVYKDDDLKFGEVEIR